MTALAGYLLASPTGAAIAREDLDTAYAAKGAAPFMKYEQHFLGLRLWETFTLRSDLYLGEDATPDSPGPPFDYRLVVARSGSKLILLADRRKIAEHAITRVIDRSIFPNLRKVHFRIDQIIHGFASNASDPAEYLVSSLHGRFAGSDRNLRTMSLYGNDLTESTVYREHHHLFNFFSCGIGRRVSGASSSTDDRELLRIGSDGSISLQSLHNHRSREVTKVIDAIIRNRWVDPWVQKAGG